jgi:hypothetical protein
VQPLAHEHERLHDARDPTVAIAERMHRDEVQMGHRSADRDVHLNVSVIEPADDLAHELGHLLIRRSDVHRWPTPRAGQLDATPAIPARVHATPAIPARVLTLLEVARVEVQVQHDALDPPEGRISGHNANVVHRAGVARQRHAVLILRVQRLVAAGHRDRLLRGNTKALDLDRALRRGRAPLTAQAPEPRAGYTRLIAEALAQLVELGELARECVVGGRSLEDHEYKYSRLYA